MQQLKERIVREGKVLPGNIIKVDGFLNHRVDTLLMRDIADEFAKHFDVSKITLVLTAEASGIALATVCAERYGVPMVFAKKAKSDNIEGGLFRSDIFSYTYKKQVTQLVSKEWLHKEDKVLIVDDFLANGEALRGLCEIVEQAGAELGGIGSGFFALAAKRKGRSPLCPSSFRRTITEPLTGMQPLLGFALHIIPEYDAVFIRLLDHCQGL